MNLQVAVGGPTNTIVLTKNQTGVTLIMDLTLCFHDKNLKGYRHEHIGFVESGYFDIPNGLARSPLRFPDPISPV